jgi:hypothetical protein
MLSGPGPNQKILNSDYALRLSDNAHVTPRLYDGSYNTSGVCELTEQRRGWRVPPSTEGGATYEVLRL